MELVDHIMTDSHRPHQPMAGYIRRISPHPSWKTIANWDRSTCKGNIIDGHLADVEYQRIGE